MRVQLIAKPDTGHTGTSRYTQNVFRGLKAAGVDAVLTSPEPIPGWLRRGSARFGLDARAFFASYPLRVRLQQADIYHITTQTMATLLLFQRFNRPVVVTVLDIIPYLVRRNKELNTFQHPVDYLLYRLALAGLRRADALIAISEYTKRTLVEALGIPAERVHVVYPAVDHNIFRRLEVPDSFRDLYGLDHRSRYLLYVGSEQPRKNFLSIVRAFARVQESCNNIRLLKVGEPEFEAERNKALKLIDSLGIRDAVAFVGHKEEELPLFYNVSQAFVFPSLYEGFGFPPLEAMACGTPVVCSNSTSLPEVVNNAALLVLPTHIDAISNAIGSILNDEQRRQQLILAGMKRAAQFSWARTAQATADTYNTVLSEQ